MPIIRVMLLWPEFIAEGRTGLNLFIRCALLIKEIDELNQKKGDDREKLKLSIPYRCRPEISSYFLRCNN